MKCFPFNNKVKFWFLICQAKKEKRKRKELKKLNYLLTINNNNTTNSNNKKIKMIYFYNLAKNKNKFWNNYWQKMEENYLWTILLLCSIYNNSNYNKCKKVSSQKVMLI